MGGGSWGGGERMNWIRRCTESCGNKILDDDRRPRRVGKDNHSMIDVGGRGDR